MKIKLPIEIEKIIKSLEDGGFEAYIVGGCVRDFIMGRTPADFDITTSATPMQIEAVFSDISGFHTVPTGIKHGTITVINGNISAEVTTFRVDGEYRDSRRPESVSFTNKLSEDLSRRDFTVCAMAYSKNGGIVDLYGGTADANNKIIRCVGNPVQRFTEDALRILRALRFASVLDFSIEEQTSKAIQKLHPRLALVSKERICAELSKLISGDGAGRILKEYSSVISGLFSGEAFVNTDKIADILDCLPKKLDLRLSAVLWGVSPEKAASILKELRFESKTVRNVQMILLEVRCSLSTRFDVKLLISRVGDDLAHDIIVLKTAFGELEDGVTGLFFDIINLNECRNLSMLAINGNDLLSLGFPSFEIGKKLDLLLKCVFSGEIENTKAALTAELTKNKESE